MRSNSCFTSLSCLKVGNVETNLETVDKVMVAFEKCWSVFNSEYFVLNFDSESVK